MSGLTVSVPAPSDMESLGRRLAAALQPGDIVLLNGSLGAGKTLLVSGIAQALGVEARVTSPSFLVVKQYEGLLPIVHADVYRLGSTAEFTDLELIDEAEDGVLLIEWGDAIRPALPEEIINVEIEVNDDGSRSVAISGEGEWSSRKFPELT